MSLFARNNVAPAVAATILAAVAATSGYWLARQTAQQPNAPSGRPILYWYDPMQPNQHFDAPGKSPFMDMQLIPKYADERGDESQGVRIDTAMVQTLGVRLTTVQRGPLSQSVDAVGSIGFNQRDVAIVQTRSAGFVTRVYARAPGDIIARNAPLVDLQIPEWTGAQTEFVALLESADSELIAAARQRLIQLGMPPDLIAEVERRRQILPSVTVRSPTAGVISTLDAREGMSIPAGATVASVNGIDSVWLEAAVPEAHAVGVIVGGTVAVRSTAFPDRRFDGRVVAILPQTDPQTRTFRVRVELPNPHGRLRPGMFADVELTGKEPESALYVATEALIRTGKRTVLIVAGEDNRFVPTEVQTGSDVGSHSVILSGVKEGQRVVASGQFLIDSEASLRSAIARFDHTEHEYD